MIPKYDCRVWDEIYDYIGEWYEGYGKKDLPDGARQYIYIIPPVIALIKNAEETEKLNQRLLGLTRAIFILTLVLVGLGIKMAFW